MQKIDKSHKDKDVSPLPCGKGLGVKPADRLNNVGEYYFSQKRREIDVMNSKGKNVISLGIGMPDLPPSDATIEALAEEAKNPNAHGYQNYNGSPELRKAYAEWYKKWFGISLNPDNEVLPLLGSKEGVLYVSMAFLNPGDGVLIPDPGYPTYSSVNNLIGAKIVPYVLKEDDGWQPDFEALEKMDLTGVKLMWVNYPNMPTGAPATIELFERLVAFGRKHNIVICNDNPYSFILPHPQPLSTREGGISSPLGRVREGLSILAVDGAKDSCIELNSMSKSHNMSGWRVGMVLSNQQYISWILQVKSNVDSGMFRPVQMAAVKALHNDDAWHYEHNVAVYAKRRIIAERIMCEMGCTFDPKQVGMFLWGKIPGSYADAGELADKILYGANVFITPGFIFGEQGKRYVRISLCATEAALQEALERIKSTQ